MPTKKNTFIRYITNEFYLDKSMCYAINCDNNIDYYLLNNLGHCTFYNRSWKSLKQKDTNDRNYEY